MPDGKSRNADELRQQLESIKRRQLALRSQIPPSGKVEHVTMPKKADEGPEDLTRAPHPKNRMSASMRSSSASALSKRSTQKLSLPTATQSQWQPRSRPGSASSVGLRLSQPRPAKSGLRASQEWVPAGALFQAPPTVSWHRSSLRPQSANLMRSSTATLGGDHQDEQVVTRAGSPTLNRRVDPRDQSSISWVVDGGDVQLHDGMGKMTLVGPARAKYKSLLSGGHLVRFLFRPPPPSSELGASVSLSSGHSGWRLFRRLAMQISSGGTASLQYNVGPATRKGADRVVPLGPLNVGEWHVCQLLVGSTGSCKAHIDVWAVPGRSDPHNVPQVGRGLHGCKRLYWHHFVFEDDALADDGAMAQQAAQQTRDWDLSVETWSGGLEVGAWRIVPMQRASLSGGLPALSTSHQQSVGSSSGGAGSRASAPMQRGASKLEAGGDPLGDVGVAGELDAQAIASSWDVPKVLRFLETFKDEFGEALTRHYADIFQSNEIDGAALLALTSADLETIGVKESGHRLLILKEIEGHLLACGSRSLSRRPPSAADHASGFEAHAPPSRAMEEPLRALLESLRHDLGDDKLREYKVVLSAAGLTSVQEGESAQAHEPQGEA